MTETEGPEVGLTETTPVPSGVESTAKARVEQQSWALGLLWGGGGKLKSDLEALLEQCATGREGQGSSCYAFSQNISTAMLEFDWGTDMCLGWAGVYMRGTSWFLLPHGLLIWTWTSEWLFLL